MEVIVMRRSWRLFLWILLGFVAAPVSAADEHAEHAVLGTVHFPVTCTSEAQQAFDEAMKLQHSFWYQARPRTTPSPRRCGAIPSARWRIGGSP
jgi:hypothetical protein